MPLKSLMLVRTLLLPLLALPSVIVSRPSKDDGQQGARQAADVGWPHCSTATIFGLATADCSARGVATLTELHLDRVDIVVLQLTNNLLVQLGADQLYNVTPRLQQLYLARNSISLVDEHAFRLLHKSLQVCF
jgi:Leucine rich repeat